MKLYRSIRTATTESIKTDKRGVAGMIKAIRGRYFRTLFLLYFLVTGLLLTLLLAFGLGQWRLEQKREAERELGERKGRIVRIVDERFSIAEQAASQIAASEWIKYASSRSQILTSKLDYFRKLEICKILGNYTDSLRIAKSVAVLFPYKDQAVDRVSFWECDRYFQSVGLSRETLEEIQTQMKADDRTVFLFGNEEMRDNNGSFALLCCLGNDPDVGQYLFVYVDGRQFTKFLTDTDGRMAGFELEYDGKTIYSLGQTAHGTDAKEEEPFPGSRGWSYRILPEENTRGQDSGPMFVSLLILSAFGILGIVLLLSWIFTRISMQPLLRLAGKLGLDRTGEGSVLEDIERSYLELNQQKERIESLGNQYYQIAEEGYLSSLLSGTGRQEEAQRLARRFGLDFSEKMHYQTLLMCYLGEDTERFLEAMLDLQLKCCRDKNVTVVYCQRESALLAASKAGTKVLSQEEESIRIWLDEKYPDLEMETYGGKAYQGLDGICKSYREALQSRQSAKSDGGTICYYPLETEWKIINFLKLGSFEEVKDIVETLRRENDSRTLLPGELTRVTEAVFRVLQRFGQDLELSVPQMPETFQTDGRPEAAGAEGWQWEFLKGILNQMQEQYETKTGAHALGKELMAYVDSHFTDAGISQQGIADVFRISRPMVSKIFKEAAGMNFIDYLHKKRVSRAQVLFGEGQRSIADVGRNVGYESEVTFKRAFVKYAGMSAREYVEAVRG